LYPSILLGLGSEFSESDEPAASSLLPENELDLPTFRSELSSTTSESKDEESNIPLSRRDSDVFIMASTSGNLTTL